MLSLYVIVWYPGVHLSINSQVYQLVQSTWLSWIIYFLHTGLFSYLLALFIVWCTQMYKHTFWKNEDWRKDWHTHTHTHTTNKVIRNRIPVISHGGHRHLHPTALQIADKSICQWCFTLTQTDLEKLFWVWSSPQKWLFLHMFWK